jgi:hypothetical protein
MKQQKSKHNFWFVLAIINMVAMVYPLSSYLQADSMEDQVLAVFIVAGVALVMGIIDTVSIVFAYSQ